MTRNGRLFLSGTKNRGLGDHGDHGEYGEYENTVYCENRIPPLETFETLELLGTGRSLPRKTRESPWLEAGGPTDRWLADRCKSSIVCTFAKNVNVQSTEYSTGYFPALISVPDSQIIFYNT